MTSTHPAGVRYGTLTIPMSGQREVDEAFGYLARDSMERSIIERLEKSRTPHRILIDHHGDDSYDPNTHIIRWDPYSALETSEGGRQSPALGLGHEMDHAVAPSHNYDLGADAIDFAYDNAEERRVIVGSERHAALTLGESVRYDHGGRLYSVADPTLR
ncbi:MAG TPA: hypothetical protein VHT05_03050 [Candidatus Elarobacter sp.]|jgi:hypothetical protein|nr:hypothetical protein [Candidatus Elarobacter sp.]